MKIILNTVTKTVTSRPHKSDKYKDRYELEADMFDLLALAVAGKICVTFKSDKVRLMMLDKIYEDARKTILYHTEKHHPAKD